MRKLDEGISSAAEIQEQVRPWAQLLSMKAECSCICGVVRTWSCQCCRAFSLSHISIYLCNRIQDRICTYTHVNLFLRCIRQFSRVWSRLSFCKVSVGLHEGTAVAPRALPSAFRVHEGVFGCMCVRVGLGRTVLDCTGCWMDGSTCLLVREESISAHLGVRAILKIKDPETST